MIRGTGPGRGRRFRLILITLVHLPGWVRTGETPGDREGRTVATIKRIDT